MTVTLFSFNLMQFFQEMGFPVNENIQILLIINIINLYLFFLE